MYRIMDVPHKRQGAVTEKAVGPFPRDFIREEVVLMWRKRLMQLLRILVIAVVTMILLTTEAC